MRRHGGARRIQAPPTSVDKRLRKALRDKIRKEPERVSFASLVSPRCSVYLSLFLSYLITAQAGIVKIRYKKNPGVDKIEDTTPRDNKPINDSCGCPGLQ